MSNLVTLNDFDGQNFRYLSKNTDIEDIEPYIIEAEEYDIAKDIGRALYYAANEAYPDSGIYSALINGGSYTNCDGDTVQNPGLKKAIMYYALARYLVENETNHTPTGFVQKETDFSVQPTQKHIQTRIDNMRSAGLATLDIIHDFLYQNREQYPLYKCYRQERKGGAIITAVDQRRRNEHGTPYNPDNKYTNKYYQ